MNYPYGKGPLALAISPMTRGFGFALFEGPTSPIHWGVKEARVDKNKRCLMKIEELINFYEPDVVIVEDVSGKGSRHSGRIRRLTRDIIELASTKQIKTQSYSRAVIKEFFAEYDAVTKHQIAKEIARWLPELESRLPPARKIWMSEDPRMSLFDAVALILTFFSEEKKEKRA
jgi:Holliday junction resolvasome RuvABC endonuclease subunit